MAEDATLQAQEHHSHHVHGRYAISDPGEAPGRICVRFMCADRKPVDVWVKEALLPGVAGVFTIMSEHTPMLSALNPGVIEVYNSQDSKDFFAISGGFAVVDKNMVTIMCEAWEHAKEIDIKRAQEARDRAEMELKKATEDTDAAIAEVALRRAVARIHAHSGISY